MQGSTGAFSAISELSKQASDAGNSEEVNTLKTQLSKKTNEILQLQDDKNELLQKLEDQRAQIEDLNKQLVQKPLDPEATSTPETDDNNKTANVSLNASRAQALAANNATALSSSLLNDIDHQE